jgi:hypothetical protein
MDHEGVDLVEYVQNVLKERVPLKNIAITLGFEDPRKLKRPMTKKYWARISVFKITQMLRNCLLSYKTCF